MSQVQSLIDERRRAGRGCLVGYLPIGFPSLGESIGAAVTLANSGVDILELGIPYSDPVMDGPVIQRATQRSLEGGFRVRQVFEALEAIRNESAIPTLVMTYWNPVLQFGVRNFAAELKKSGASGLITPDLIPDEAKDWIEISSEFDLDRVFLAAPSSSKERLDAITRNSRGFVYAVSTMGTTGSRSELDSAARALVGRLREANAERICVGLGISTPEQVAEVLKYADGAIVGSAFVSSLETGGIEALRAKAQALSGSIRLG